MVSAFVLTTVGFKNSLRYVSAAPELVFERLVVNVCDSPLVISRFRADLE